MWHSAQRSVFQVQVQSCFMSTETVRTIRDGESRTAISTFTQLWSSVLSGVVHTFLGGGGVGGGGGRIF